MSKQGLFQHLETGAHLNQYLPFGETNINEENSLPLTTSLMGAMLGEVGYVVVAIVALLATLVYIKYTYDNRAFFRILRLECILTIICLFGKIGLMVARLLEASHPNLCIPSTALILLDLSLLTGTRWYISNVR